MDSKVVVRILPVGTPTSDGHIFSKEIVEDMIKNFSGEVYGELRPASRGQFIDCTNLSHKITGLRVEDGYLVGDLEVLDTAQGDILKKCFAEKIRYGIRATCTERRTEPGEPRLINDIKLISIDAY